MIRFSAGLVVVAIGVLIGGVATSKLSLVYVAIAVSAVALVALAIGVALKRDELFGGGPELAPAGAGAGSGMPAGQPAGAGDVRGKDGHVREDQQPIQKKVPGPATAAFAAAEAASAAAAASTVKTPSVTPPPVMSPPVGPSATAAPVMDKSPFGNPSLEHGRTAFGQAQADEGDAAADWQPRSPQPAWSSGDQVRPTWTPAEQASKASTPTVPQSGAASAPARSWGSPDQAPAPPARAGSGTVTPSWFDRLNQPVAATAARTGTDQATAESATTEPEQADPAKADPADVNPAETTSASASAADAPDADLDDDDWPTRYSWLDDDETDEVSSDAAEVSPADDAPAADNAAAPDTVPMKARTPEPAAASADLPAAPSPATVDADDADDAGDPEGSADETPAVDAADEHEDEDDEPPAPQRSDAKLVTVIPGVPRYHNPDCILIRFMDPEDVATKSIPEARAANCTPCAACQPED